MRLLLLWTGARLPRPLLRLLLYARPMRPAPPAHACRGTC